MNQSILLRYLFGFIISIILTSIAFLVVLTNYSSISKIFIIFVVAIVQLYIQLVFFMHLDKEQSPKWNVMMFLLATWFVVAVVIGSIWIMSHLHYNMMPEESDQYLMQREGIKANSGD